MKIFIIILVFLLVTACVSGPLIMPDEKIHSRIAIQKNEPENWPLILPLQLKLLRESIEKYKDFKVAKKEGWKPFGGEAPLMGTHYSNKSAPDYVYGDTLDFSKPNNLMYATIDGEKILTGVAFVVRLAENEPLPKGFAGPQDRWHVHNFLDAVNAFLVDRPLLRGVTSWWFNNIYLKQNDQRHRLAMIHAWVVEDNPDGMFADYNRLLPYKKLGLPASFANGQSIDTARAVNFATKNGCKESVDLHLWIANVSNKDAREIRLACRQAAAKVKQAIGKTAIEFNAVAEQAWQEFDMVYRRLLTSAQRGRVAAITEHSNSYDTEGYRVNTLPWQIRGVLYDGYCSRDSGSNSI